MGSDCSDNVVSVFYDNTPKEFPPNLCNAETDWLTGKCRKTSKEEFWGFEDWKKVTKLHLEMEIKLETSKYFSMRILFLTRRKKH